ncbi:hypothetical protein HW555_013732 [Spodoptera exigua]|uniref:Zinc finger ZPR1-type domain-containing protein n=1 Tax=Spodoptera exigua TaxID=7107 RepID=A0A835G2B5_SPOEX|nr:hypothetical protein HW555_013732 [Spodoptera exigua]
MSSEAPQPVFRSFGGEPDEEPEVTEIESLCMNCHENGMTRLLLTRIPYYKNVVVMSFSCEHCGYQNNELQPGGSVAERGVRWALRVEGADDLNRQVVKSDYTSVRIPSLDFEIPAQSQKGEVTTVEGIISRAVAGLTQDQEARRLHHPEDARAIDEYVARLDRLRQPDAEPWTLELEDISEPVRPAPRPARLLTHFKRTHDQDHQLGIYTNTEKAEDTECPRIEGLSLSEGAEGAEGSGRTSKEHLLSPLGADAMPYERLAADEVLSFPTNCPNCDAPCYTLMKVTNIPHFKEVVIMSTTCDYCGHRTNEVKSGGGIEEKGVRFEVRVATKEDFSRDILKSETCSMEIPELELSVGGGALGGRFTTAEGILSAMRGQLEDSPGALGDAPGLAQPALQDFLATLDQVLRAERPVTIVLDDPAGNSYVQSLADDPNVPDDGLKITRYERTFEQNEELGLNDINTENYRPPTPS